MNASTGEVYVVVTELENNVAHRSLANLEDADDDDVVFVENNEPENDAIPTNLSDFKETDDEIIFVENNVEVIEIDDDDDEEVIYFTLNLGGGMNHGNHGLGDRFLNYETSIFSIKLPHS